jgi:diaminobutyrate-2-oxoglutarate transaminase
MEFEELSFAEAPKIVEFPGSRSKELLQRQRSIEGHALSYPLSVPIVMDEGRGATIKDVDGNVFIDFLAGAAVLAVGHCNPFVLDAVREQLKKITHTLDFPTEIRIELMEKIRSVMPDSLKDDIRVQFGGPTGSDAVEMALKLARYYTDRHAIISFEGSYHGMTAGALSVSGGKFWKEKFMPLVPEVHFIPFAYCYRCPFNQKPDTCDLECASYYEHIIEDPYSGVVHPAAVLIEPIQGEGGSLVPPPTYVKRIEEISRQYDVPFICDEVQAGFCRTGKFFSFEYSQSVPDIMPISKALGGGLPLSAIVYREEFDVWKKSTHIGTFRGNVTAMAAGVAVIDFMVEHDLAGYATKIGNFMLGKLEKIGKNSSSIGEVRGSGLMIGVEIVKDKETKEPDQKLTDKIRRECLERGAIVEIGGHYDNVIRFLPPLVITKELAEKGVDIFGEAMETMEKDL